VDELGALAESKKLRLHLRAQAEKIYGVGHPYHIQSILQRHGSCYRMWQWWEAETLLDEVKTLAETNVVESLQDRNIIANLAFSYSLQGRWREAEELELQVMQRSVTALGEEHPQTLISMDSLALTLLNQGQWKDAEKLFVKVVNVRKRELGLEHPDTITSIGNLAKSYLNQGRLQEAEKLLVQAMLMMKECLVKTIRMPSPI